MSSQNWQHVRRQVLLSLPSGSPDSLLGRWSRGDLLTLGPPCHSVLCFSLGSEFADSPITNILHSTESILRSGAIKFLL